MAIRVAINHSTTYHYDRNVSLSPHVFRLRPAVHSRTPIEAYCLKIKPVKHFINWQQDPFGNYQARVVFPEPTNELSIEVEIIARMTVINPFDFFVEKYAAFYPFVYPENLKKELAPYLETKETGPLLLQWLNEVKRNDKTAIVDFLVQINQCLNKDIRYTIRMEPGVQTTEETLSLALGSCRDSAWLLVQILRQLGLASRFVSGYLVQLTADVKPLDGPSGPEADITDLHAWAEVYIPGAGWIGLDPTTGLFAGEGHIPLACTPDYASAAPVVGTKDFSETSFSFSNTVTRIHEDPRVTKPYTGQQWAVINATGYKVDADLEAGDVRLTMGGEPTFVSIDDMESAQWNTAADGLHKRILAHDLIFRLRNAFGPDGMLHYGQGKWYPGEPLPRWQYGLYWRKDGVPLWKNKNLMALENHPVKYICKDAEVFANELAKHLAVDPENIMDAYEDVFYFLWCEGKTPLNIDPLLYNLKDSVERRTLGQLLERGLDSPAGFVLPVEWNYWNNRWRSQRWELKRDYLFLMPGNSPIGLRLPLQSLPKLVKGKEQVVERSLFETLEPLPSYQEVISSRYGTISQHPPITRAEAITQQELAEPKPKTSGKEIIEEIPPLFEVDSIRTAICVEARDGILYVFLPPVSYLEHYLDLVASVEATAEKLQMPVRIEGYEPPRDYRMERLVISPDPGVIEVNIHPAKNWKELVHHTQVLYQEAFLSRLGTEKFMLDGKHTGTGGGNHVTIGGEKPADSPILRRPDLLRSLLTYWQHYPVLSYLFSGAFIGATSQAPRIDEGRVEKLYELEIAFKQIPSNCSVPFWLVDRLFRHLLTDLTGNTHRSELCIDKLYAPDSSSGRLGILEFRALDMPPHQQMSLVQKLLIRSLIAKFWKQPYEHDLVRWGTELQDKFMLEHYLRKDMEEVVRDLTDAGYDFDMSWFEPFFEFRFPQYGTVMVGEIEMEIRMAIEPWHVLGEEMSSSGTARFVDSSMERVQVKLKNVHGDRYILLCNGCRVPLSPTSVKGEYVCGIRYRAWQPPSALHPTIGIDSPLVFDVVDTWNKRSVGGCTYFVTHPGGRNYDTIPVNSNEAEARRVSRFWDHGHSPGVILTKIHSSSGTVHRVEQRLNGAVIQSLPRDELNKEYTHTLDLRQFWNKKMYSGW